MLPAFAKEEIKVSGTVVDENDEPMIGVTIMEDGSTNGTTTDLDGHFYINVKGPNSILKFSYVGYKSLDVKVGKKISFDIHMEPALGQLDEVVVVGYGKQVRASVVGSITGVEPENLRVGSTANVADNLAGQLAGVIAYKPSGRPGYDSSEFWIRGLSSFNGSNNPLVLIDGVERDLDDIDAAEIESFSILKDAAASAVYGVRGANGVILVNTKRGKVGAPQVAFRFEQSFREPTKLPEFVSGAESMMLINELYADYQGNPDATIFDPERIALTISGYDPELYPDVNWIDQIFRESSNSSRANLNVSGGSDFLRYALTASWYRESGIMERDSRLPYDTSTRLNKYSVRANVDMNVTKTTLLRFNVGGYMQDLRQNAGSSPDDVYYNAFSVPRYLHPAQYSDGSNVKADRQQSNPWAMLTQQGYETISSSKIEAMVSVEQDLKFWLPGLKARGLFSFDTWNGRVVRRQRTPTYFSPSTARDEEGNLIPGMQLNDDGSDYLGHYAGVYAGNQRTYLELGLNYDQTFKDVHRVSGMFTFNRTSYDDMGIQPYRHQGIAGRASYTYDSRYIAEFNFGYNGSENFAPGKRYGFFPSGAIGWIASNEKFWAPIVDKVNLFKVRASIGKVGNDQLGDNARRFAYITTLNTDAAGYRYGYQNDYSPGAGIMEGEVGVTNLTWETVTKYNLGFELGLLYQLNLQVDIFKENRKDIFIQRQTIPTQAGFSSMPWANMGKVDNKGIEIQLDYHKAITDDIQMGLRGTFTYAKNKITECDEPESVKGTHRSRTGRSINELYGYTALGLYTFEDFGEDGNLLPTLPQPKVGGDSWVIRPGDIKYADLNGDGVIDALDRGYIGGTTVPRIVYGFGGNLIAKNVDFSFFFQGTGDHYRMLAASSLYLVPGAGMGSKGNIWTNYQDRWTEENPSQDVFWPRLYYGPNTHNNQASTWYKKSMAFLRLKTIEVGYTLPKKWSRKYGSSSTRIYVSGNDLFQFTNFKLWDPELDTTEGTRYPLMRTIMVGAELKF